MSKQTASDVRAALKAAGYNARRVSVRNDSYSMGSTVRVTVKDATADFDEIQRTAEAFAKVDRCELTGEILSGGNTFIDVSWSTEARAERAARYAGSVRHALEALDLRGENDHSLEQVAPGVYVGRDGFDYQLWNGDQAGMHFDKVHGIEFAAAIVADYVDAREREERAA